MRIAVSSALLGLSICACGGSVDRASSRAGGATDGTGASASGSGGAAGAGQDAAVEGGAAGLAGGGGSSTKEPFDDPGCPDVRRRPGLEECDPFAASSGCPFGERCIPYVEYADECQTEEFGTRCTATGTGMQGDDCETDACAERHVCVTTGEGSQCARICRIDAAGDDCAAGLLCQSLDVDGFFICF